MRKKVNLPRIKAIIRAIMSVRKVEQAIKDVKPIIEDWDRRMIPDYNEKCTRRLIIDPILTALGWDSNNLSHLIEEYYISEDSGHHIDYAMFTSSRDVTIIVEAKRLSEDTRDHNEQLEMYEKRGGAKNVTAVLTNGRYWIINHIGDDLDDIDKEKPIGLLDTRYTSKEQAQRLYDALSRDKHWELTNRGGDIRRWRQR